MAHTILLNLDTFSLRFSTLKQIILQCKKYIKFYIININERIILSIKLSKNIILFNTSSKIMKYFQFCKKAHQKCNGGYRMSFFCFRFTGQTVYIQDQIVLTFARHWSS